MRVLAVSGSRWLCGTLTRRHRLPLPSLLIPPGAPRSLFMPRWMYFLLLALPATFIAEALHASPVAVFLLAALALVPLAGLIGLATEALAERLNYTLGGLLNATF